jgi:hypothetical protein
LRNNSKQWVQSQHVFKNKPCVNGELKQNGNVEKQLKTMGMQPQHISKTNHVSMVNHNQQNPMFQWETKCLGKNKPCINGTQPTKPHVSMENQMLGKKQTVYQR